MQNHGFFSFLDMLVLHFIQDKTFTCTLFAPSSELDRLRDPGEILAWFRSYFPDAVGLIGEKKLIEDFIRNPRSPLICTKVIYCSLVQQRNN